MNKIFLTFADSRLSRSLKRISQEAIDMGVYSTVLALTENDLSPIFKKHFQDKLRPSIRGFGYWCWKPQIVSQVLESMREGDMLHYCDVGCHLNFAGKNRLQEYFDIASKNTLGLLAFQAVKPSSSFGYDGRELLNLRDGWWTKGDLLDHFCVRYKPEIVETQTIGSGIFIARKNDFTVRFFQEWLNVYSTNFGLADDSASRSPNLNGFIEHRHDQSIFSIMCKLKGVETLSAYEYWYPSKDNLNKPDWGALKNYPIWAMRNKDFGFLGNIIMWFKSKYGALKRKLDL